MGRKGKWYIAVKKVFSSQGSEHRLKKHKPKKKWRLRKTKVYDPNEKEINENSVKQSTLSSRIEIKKVSSSMEISLPSPVVEFRQNSSLVEIKPHSPVAAEVKLPCREMVIKKSPALVEVKLPEPMIEFRLPIPSSEEFKTLSTMEELEKREEELVKHERSVAFASALAVEAAAVAAQAAAEVVRLTATTRIFSKTREVAAITIQNAFRGYLARKALRALRALVRLKKLVNENAVKRQTANALHSMQELSRVQAQIQARRMRLKDENQALRRQLLLERERELEMLKVGEEWVDSLHSKEQIVANISNKHEAVIKRERALAYAFSHQRRGSSRALTPMFSDLSDPHWGWTWLERWTAARPFKETSDRALRKTVSHKVQGPRVKSVTHRDSNIQCISTSGHKSNCRPPSSPLPTTPLSRPSSVSSKKESISPSAIWVSINSDTRSVASTGSQYSMRLSTASSFSKDDESLGSSSAVPNYMASTESARAKSRVHSPQTNLSGSKKGSISLVKKRLSFPTVDTKSISSPTRVELLIVDE